MSIQNNTLPDNPNIEIIKANETGIFTNYIYKAIPLAFDESMSYYETLCGLLNYLKNTILPTVNNNADAVAELQTLYEKLRTFVDEYFTNLDVQEEINNKLDEMAENGSLYNIIKRYTDPIVNQQNEQITGIRNYVNESIDEIENELSTIASGSPAGVYATLTDLTTDNPNHSKIYVVTADGKWYYYNTTTSSWTAGGTYIADTYDDTILANKVNQIEKSIKPSKNLYNTTTVEVHTYGGNRQTFKINKPIYNHYYALFKRNGEYAYLDSDTLLIQYNASDGVLHQYNNTSYNSYSIESNCEYIVFASVNRTDIPLTDLMVVDITGLNPSDFEKYDNGYSTIDRNTNIEEVKATSIEFVKPYNLYNTNNVLTLQTDAHNYQKQIFYCNAGNKYRFLTSTLQRLANINYNNKNVIAWIYNADGTTSRTLQNPTEDITVVDNEKRIELFIQNSTSIPYNDILVLRVDYITDNDINKYGFLPYSYILQNPFYAESTILTDNSINKPYKGKKILSIGDSYTYLNYYGDKMAEITGCQQTPRGYNGARIFNFVSDYYTPTGGGGNLVEQTFDESLLAPYDIITVMGGINNYGYSTQPLGTINDPAIAVGSVYSEIKYVIEKILTLKPSIKIVWCTQPYALSSKGYSAPGGYAPNNQGFTIRDVADAIINVCKMYGIPVFDFNANSGWNPMTVKKVNGELIENKYTYDGLHPKDGTGNGGELLGEQFGMFINSI